MDTGRLSGLNEAETGELKFVGDSADEQHTVDHKRLELLARGEWGGVGDMAQILAAFVSPNDAVVAAILKNDSMLLERAGKDGSIDGYQTKDPGRAWLLAAAFDVAGFNPVVLFSHGHAWVGVWLVERDFGYVPEPDVVAVRKAAQACEFIPIETTLATKRLIIRFEQAVDGGRRRLSEESEDEFVVTVDISRARAA